MSAERPLTAIALAGGILEVDFRGAGYAAPNKAYLRLDGPTMLERVLRALRSAHSIGAIRCVTPPDVFAQTFGERAATLCDAVIAPGEHLIDSLLAGCRGLSADDLVLVTATDIPLATAPAFDAFAGAALAADCDVAYGYVNRDAHNRRYPQVRHTWVRLREGTFCGAGASVVRIGGATRIANLLHRLAAARRSPLRLALLFSPLLIARFVLGRVPIAELERRAQQISGLRCRGVLCEDPELAVNVDRLEDLRAVEAIVRAQDGCSRGNLLPRRARE